MNTNQRHIDEPLTSSMNKPRLHYSWVVAAATFAVLLLSASVRGTFSLLIEPLHTQFGWSRTAVTTASTINLVLNGLLGPIAAALMIRFGLRKIATTALALMATGAALATLATQAWHLWLTWGVLMGLGQGCLMSVLAATVASTWFVEKRATVSGVLIGAGTAGTLIFLPLNRWLVDNYSWQQIGYCISSATLLGVPIVIAFIRNKPEDKNLRAYGAPENYVKPVPTTNPLRAAWTGLTMSLHSGIFWTLMGSFTVCGITTSGMIMTHFVDAAHDHGITRPAAASLIVLMGVCDLLGALGSGWLSDRYEPRKLLFAYYSFRGLSLLVFDQVLGLGSSNALTMLAIAFYGLGWIATVPPTVKLANDLFPGRGPIIYGWVFAGHQLGGGAAAALTAWSRDRTGNFQTAFVLGGVLALITAFACLGIGRDPSSTSGLSDKQLRSDAVHA